jgi:hypothetical protein
VQPEFNFSEKIDGDLIGDGKLVKLSCGEVDKQFEKVFLRVL